MQRDEFIMTVHTICEGLSLLDPGSYWEINPDKGHSSYIPIHNRNNEYEEIAIHYHERENKFNISVNWPYRNDQSLAPYKPYDHKGQWFSFGCTASKAPAIIAREIHRRLLGDYRVKLAEVLHDAQVREDFEKRRAKLAEGICTMLEIPYKADKKSSHGYPAVTLPYGINTSIGLLDIEIADENDININIHCRDLTLASSIIAAIKNYIVAQGKPGGLLCQNS